MKIQNCERSILVKRFRSSPSIGGVSMSIEMSRVIVILFLVFVTVQNHAEMIGRKTTDTGAMPQGKSAARHMAMVMGSVEQCNSDLIMPGETPPPWVKDFKVDLINTINESADTIRKDITSKVDHLGKDLAEYKEANSKAIEKVESSVESLTIQTESLASRVEKMEKEKSSWEKKMESDLAKINSGLSTVTVPGYPTQDDMDEYDVQYDKMERTVGLAPFTHDDMEAMKKHLTSKEFRIDPHNLLSSCLFDFWKHDMGCSDETVQQLADELEQVWWDKLRIKSAGPGDMVIFARFKTVMGRLTMYTHAKSMNRMSKKWNVEYRKIILDICPQLERRFGVLNKLQYRFRKEQEEKGEPVQTRIWIEEKTIYLQYRMEPTELYRTLDIERAYPDVVLPGVRYNDKVPFLVKPKGIKYDGKKTPPGRLRSNRPILRPDGRPNPPLATVHGANISRPSSSFTDTDTSKNQHQSSKNNRNTAASVLSKDLDNLDSLISFDPLTSTSKQQAAPQYNFDVARSFRCLPGAPKDAVEQLAKTQSEDNILQRNQKRKSLASASQTSQTSKRTKVRPSSQPDLRTLLAKLPSNRRGQDDDVNEETVVDDEGGDGDINDSLGLGALEGKGNY